MSVTTTADIHYYKAEELVNQARENIAQILADEHMWGSGNYDKAVLVEILSRLIKVFD